MTDTRIVQRQKFGPGTVEFIVVVRREQQLQLPDPETGEVRHDRLAERVECMLTLDEAEHVGRELLRVAAEWRQEIAGKA